MNYNLQVAHWNEQCFHTQFQNMYFGEKDEGDY